jgi:CYTH domain-containing protein
MGKEIERKYLVKDKSWKSDELKGKFYRQGYLYSCAGITTRIRIAGEKAFLTIKGKAEGICRDEFEYEIPLADAKELLDNFCEKPLIEKTRYKLDWPGCHELVVDEFYGENEGLILAEIELENENDTPDLPDWFGLEVSGDPRYYNASLVKNPFTRWRSDQ